mmetsp:Transcript_16519/g.14420  ORF Transcript_16519/g.14420 Transcript_16519/m.14420 type:complete len:251 (+) Transcript_16519:153-905(+)
MCKTKSTLDPKPNFALLEVVDVEVKEKTITVNIGKVPHFIDVVMLREKFLNKFDSGENIVSVSFQDDIYSSFYSNKVKAEDSKGCEEKLVVIEYKDVDKKEVIQEFDGKIFTLVNQELHCMLNVTSTDNKCLHPEVSSIFKAKGYDIVMLVPSKPAFGYDFCIKMDQKFVSKDMQISLKWIKDLKFLSKGMSQLKAVDVGKVYLILHFVDQEDLMDAHTKLVNYSTTKLDTKYKLEPLNNCINIFELTLD